MAETVLCSNDDVCNCTCNCQAFLTNNRKITVEPMEVDGNNYTFRYTITNQYPAISFVVFCVECPRSTIEISSTNTSIVIIGDPNDSPEMFTECFISGCESEALNRFYVEYDLSNEPCCRYQGIKIDINPVETLTEISFALTFTLPEDLTFGFTSGNLKIKTAQVLEIVNDLCMPGCIGSCNMDTNTCNLWKLEKNILESNKDIFIKFSQLILPPTLDLNSITVTELENKIRSISKLQNTSANLICNVAKALETLSDLKTNGCYSDCTQCAEQE